MSREARWTRDKVCEACGRSYMAARSDSRSCGPTCKKALQRGSKTRRVNLAGGGWRAESRLIHAGHVPFIAAAIKAATPTPAEFRANYSQGHLVTFIAGPGGWRPGRINWHSQAGQECMADMELQPWENWVVGYFEYDTHEWH